MKSDRVRTDLPCLHQAKPVSQISSPALFLLGTAWGLFSITDLSASGKHRCRPSLEIQIHLLHHVQEEGQRGVSRDGLGEGWLSGQEPREIHKSCWLPGARRSDGSQVRGPPAARGLDAVTRWPQEVLRVGVCGSLHPGSNLWPVPALSLCVSLYISPSSALTTSPLPFSLLISFSFFSFFYINIFY